MQHDPGGNEECTIPPMAEISIITICKNDPEGLTRTWKSVTGCILPDMDWIVIDADSGEETQQVLNGIRAEGWTAISEPDDGIYDGMRKGLERTEGQWVLYMNAGDEFADPDVLQDVQPLLRKAPVRSIVFGDAIECPPDGMTRLRMAPGFDQIESGMPASHQSIFFNRDALVEFPFQMGSSSADWIQLLAMHLGGVKTIRFRRAVCRFDTTGISRTNWRNSIRERTEHLRKSGRWTPALARKYRHITLHAMIANGLAAIIPRSMWIRIARASKVFRRSIRHTDAG